MKLKMHLELELTVEAELCKAVPASRHYPGDPASINDYSITELAGAEINGSLSEHLCELYGDDIEQAIWEEAGRQEDAMYEQEAKDLEESKLKRLGGAT